MDMWKAILVSLVAGGVGQVHADLRCDLAMQVGAQGSSCLDPVALKGKTVTVPSNVTRIGQDGLALCTQKTSANLATDIEYVIDNSASMTSKVFWVDPASGDTSWYIQDCYNDESAIKAVATAVKLRQRHFGGAGTGVLGWETLYKVPSTSPRPSAISATSAKNCLEANDPYSYRAEAVNQAIQYQASLDSTAQAGMIQFSETVVQHAPMRALAGSGLSRLLDSVGLYGAASGTVWSGPLDTAFRRLKASPNAQKAIIMVSDGEPSDKGASGYRAVIAQAGFPKVYGIYLGAANSSVPEMTNLTKTTGGQFWIVPPDRPDSLQSVIRSIVGSLNTVSTPASTKLTNLTNGQGSKALKILQKADSTFQLQLDSVIALKQGKNSMVLVSTWTDAQGVVNSDTSKFVLDVSGAPAVVKDTAQVLGDTLFSTVCSDPSSLSFLDPSKATVPFLTEGMGGFFLSLKPSTQATLAGNSIQVATRAKGDKERVSTLVKNGSQYLASMVLQVPRPWSNAAGKVDANDGLDTLVASWCYPRDSRDCAEDTIQVQSYVSPWIAFEQPSWTGPVAAMGVKASLPGIPAGESVVAKYWLRGRLLVTRSMRIGADSLYHDTLKVRQGTPITSLDTLWISKPGLEDSIIVSAYWSIKDTTVADTARILRPSLSLDLQNLGNDSASILLSKGAFAALDGKRTVVLSVGTRTLAVTLDSLQGSASVLGLLGGSTGSTAMVHGYFADPVYGDTARDSIEVPVPPQSLRFVQSSAFGPRGGFDLVARVPWISASTLAVRVVHGADSVPVVLTRSPSGDYLGSIAFVQSRLASGDTLAIGLPTVVGGADSLRAVLPSDGVHPALEDRAAILRPALALEVARLGKDSVSLQLSGGAQADLSGRWNVSLTVEGESSTAVLSARTGSASVNALLSKALLDPTWIVGRFVDPLYGDTVTDSVQFPVPQRSLEFKSASVVGPRGQLSVVAYDPWIATGSMTVLIVHGADTLPLLLTRTVAGDFLGTFAFSQAKAAGTDTLVLGAPTRLGGSDSLVALLPGDGVHPALRDTAWVLRPAFALSLTVDPSRAQLVRAFLAGGTADSAGRATALLDRPVATALALEGAGAFRWNGMADLSGIAESLDSVTVRGFYADPLYGDTAWAAVRMASPWFPGSVTASPDSLDPRQGDSLWITVKDRDPDSSKVDTVTLTNGTQVWMLLETGKATGEYRLRLSARSLDSAWATRAPRKAWSVVLTYVDPRHPQDIARDTARLSFTVPPPQVSISVPVAEVRTGPAQAGSFERSNGAQGIALEMLADTLLPKVGAVPQGVVIRLWEAANVALYVYDQIGTAVSSWKGEVVPKDAQTGALGLIRWDGRDQSGRPATVGVYVVRVVVYSPVGGLISNDLVHIGLR